MGNAEIRDTPTTRVIGGFNMIHRIQKAIPKDNLILEVLFFNGETKSYDVRQLFDEFPQFRVFLSSKDLFQSVVVDEGGYGISWNDELDLDSQSIWDNGIIIETVQERNLNHLLAYQLLLAREKNNITQKELAEKTGIYQADISKLERGLGNPSLSTLKRLADGMGMDVKIDFIMRNEK